MADVQQKLLELRLRMLKEQTYTHGGSMQSQQQQQPPHQGGYGYVGQEPAHQPNPYLSADPQQQQQQPNYYRQYGQPMQDPYQHYPPQSDPWYPNGSYQQQQQQQQQQLQLYAMMQMQQQQQREAMLRHKREMLDAADRATEKLRMQVRMAMSDRDRQLREQQLAQLANAVDKLANSGSGASLAAAGGGGGGGDSKLDAILAQTLQMQSMFMARMAQGDVGGGGGMMMGMGDGAGVRPFIGKNQAGARNMQGEMVGAGDGSVSPEGGVMGSDEQQRMMQKQGLLPQESTRSPEDDELLNKMMKLTEQLSKAEGVAKSSADAAVEAAAKAVVQANPNLDLKKKKAKTVEEGGVGGEEGEQEVEEEEVVDVDEILQEEFDTYFDVARSWLRKLLRVVLGNVLTEPKTHLEVQPPFKGSLLRKGLSQDEVDLRLMKLGVRLKGIASVLDEALQPKSVPETLLTFLKRVIAPSQSFPDDYFLQSERAKLEFDPGVHRTGADLTDEQAKFLVHQFLFARVVCSDLVLKPWAFGIGAPIPPGKVEVNNLRVLAFLLYHSSCCALAGDDTDVPGFVQDDSIREEIGTLPGDEAYLLERTKELRAELKAKFKELTERLYAQLTAKRVILSITPIPTDENAEAAAEGGTQNLAQESVANTASNSPVKDGVGKMLSARSRKEAASVAGSRLGTAVPKGGDLAGTRPGTSSPAKPVPVGKAGASRPGTGASTRTNKGDGASASAAAAAAGTPRSNIGGDLPAKQSPIAKTSTSPGKDTAGSSPGKDHAMATGAGSGGGTKLGTVPE